MAVYLLQMTLFPSSNVTADVSTNSWSCEADSVADAESFKDSVIVLYNSFRSRLAGTIRQNNNEWKIYDRSDPLPRAPRSEGTWNFTTAPSGNSLPPEVALCLSFQGVRQSGQPQARRRGRVYMGPLNSAALETTGRPTALTVTTLRDAGNALRTASVAAAGWAWTVHSPTSGQDVSVSNGWVDDEFDTQRRRGREATSRNVFP